MDASPHRAARNFSLVSSAASAPASSFFSSPSVFSAALFPRTLCGTLPLRSFSGANEIAFFLPCWAHLGAMATMSRSWEGG